MTHHILQIHQETYFEILYVFEIKINEMRQKLKIVMTKSDILNTFSNPFDFQFDTCVFKSLTLQPKTIINYNL